MNLFLINQQIKALLSQLDYGTLPIYPNIVGFINQHTITYIIASGKYNEDDYIDLELRISIATQKRAREDLPSEPPSDLDSKIEENLDDLIDLILKKFHKRPLKGTRPIKAKSFEVTTPQSGKWRALVLFSITTTLESDYENEIDPTDPLTKIIDRRYIESAV